VAATPLAVVAGEIVPHTGEQDTPPCVRVQFTPLLVPSPVTVAVNCCLPLRATPTGLGETDTRIGRTWTGKAPAKSFMFVTEVATIAKKPLKK
jgi:hypothetical protein